jgi:two-component system chemotaxis response regulator CheY
VEILALKSQLKILVVEDVLTTQVFIKRLLKNLGFENIVLAEDGESAFYEIKHNKFDLIISDWKMPNMDGMEFLKAVRKHPSHRDVPFIMLTGETELERVKEAVKAGVNQYVVKPISAEILKTKIESLL